MQLTWQFFATLLTVAGVVPALTALATKLTAAPWVKTVVSGLLAMAGAVIAYLVDIEGIVDWTQVAIIAATAWGLAGGFRTSTVVGDVEEAIAVKTADVGIG